MVPMQAYAEFGCRPTAATDWPKYIFIFLLQPFVRTATFI